MTTRPSKTRRVAALTLVVGVAAGLVGAAAYAASSGDGASLPKRTNADRELDWQARGDGIQVLGGVREPGVPSVQRQPHDKVDFTVTVAPARPGPNLVRVDATNHQHAGAARKPVYVGTSADFEAGRQVRAAPRPGASGLWAVVDLPEGSGTVLVSHGPRHRVPFALDTGAAPSGTDSWTGADGPECVTAATAAVLAGGEVADSCPADSLSDADAVALDRVVAMLADRGLEELAVEKDDSARSSAAYELVGEAAAQAGIRVVEPSAAPGPRNALLVVSGWDDGATTLAKTASTPLRQQPIRSDGTWLAPWLLTPAVVDSTLGAVLPLDFDIRDGAAQEFSQTLAALFPGQSPTASGYVAWRAARGIDPDPLALFAASRAAYMPKSAGHAGHESEVAWFPGGTVTPVARLS